MRPLSDDGAAFIAREEGAVPFWYLDAASHWTIGIGHLRAGDEFADVARRHRDGSFSAGRRLTEAEMWDLFRSDAARYVQVVDRLVTVDLSQRQFDMLVDFAFNWGIGEVGGFPATSVLRLLNAGDLTGVAHDLVHGRGPVTKEWPQGRPYDKGLAGVRARRQREAEAFVSAGTVDIMRRVATRLGGWGVPVAYVPGWESRGRPYQFAPRGLVDHHTATRSYANDYPSLGIVRDGRSDLPGPLSQFGTGRHTGTIYFIAAGYANHAGAGGWRGLSGNGSVWGNEAENDGVGEAWSAVSIRSQVCLAAALAIETPFSAEMVPDHREWSSYKIDRTGVDSDWFRSEVARQISGGDPPPPPSPVDPWTDLFVPILVP